MIVSIFQDVVLFFNIDAVIHGISWLTYIESLQKQFGQKITIGVFYAKKQDRNIKSLYERKFLIDIGITGGCIQLEYQKKLNYGIMMGVLFANQAKGRRKNIRALCTKEYSYSFMQNEITYSGTLQDISLSHFSFISTDKALDFQIGSKISEFQFYLKGFLFRSPVVLIMNRKTKNSTLYVFAFLDENGGSGLTERYKQSLIPNIYALLNNNFRKLMNVLSAYENNIYFDFEEINELEID